MAENKNIVDETMPEIAPNSDVQRKRVTHTQIDNTLYIVESVQSPSAVETVCNKVKRLILNNAART